MKKRVPFQEKLKTQMIRLAMMSLTFLVAIFLCLRPPPSPRFHQNRLQENYPQLSARIQQMVKRGQY